MRDTQRQLERMGARVVDFTIPEQMRKSALMIHLKSLMDKVKSLLGKNVSLSKRSPEIDVIRVMEGSILLTHPGSSFMKIIRIEDGIAVYHKGIKAYKGKDVFWNDSKEERIRLDDLVSAHFSPVGFKDEIDWPKVDALRASGR